MISPARNPFLAVVIAGLGLAGLALLFHYMSPSYRWEQMARKAEFTTRDGAGLVSHNGKLYLLGGWEHEKRKPVTSTSEVWVSENDGVNWRLLTTAPWTARHGAGWVSFGDKLWVISGDGHEDVWSSPDGVEWKQELDHAPWGRRYAPYVAVFKDRLWIIGGLSFKDLGATGLPLNDVWSSADGVQWQQEVVQANFPPRGLIHGMAVLGNKLWLMGGGSKGDDGGDYPGETLTEYNDVWCSEDGKAWKRVLAHAPWAPRTHLSVAAFDGNLFVTDGSVGVQEGLSNEVWYSPDGVNWQELEETPWGIRHASSLTVHNDHLYLAQGFSRRDVWRLEGKGQ